MKNRTPIDKYKRDGKNLLPPFAQLPNMKGSSGIDERAPETLWLILIIGNFDRKYALDFFRHIGKFIEKNEGIGDIRHSSIETITEELQEDFIKHISEYSDEVNNILSSLLLYEKLPVIKIGNKYLNKPVPKKHGEYVFKAFSKIYNHQSQEATDVRWVLILSAILGGKVKLMNEDQYRKITKYPNFGKMTEVRFFIRASEMMFSFEDNNNADGLKHFGDYSYKNTKCMPENDFINKAKDRGDDFEKFTLENREFYIEETIRVRNNLINSYFDTVKQVSPIDVKHESIFGFGLFAMSFMSEATLFNSFSGITSRVGLRTLVEIYITLAYLIKKEQDGENLVYDDYRVYGTGEINKIILKFEKYKLKVNSIDIEDLEIIGNEDKGNEFIPIKLGHGGNTNLRKMSEETKLEDVYNKYYDYASGFSHGTGGSVRESVYQKCLNPLHRLHRIPNYELAVMLNSQKDFIEITNNILKLISDIYPDFKDRINLFEEEK